MLETAAFDWSENVVLAGTQAREISLGLIVKRRGLYPGKRPEVTCCTL